MAVNPHKLAVLQQLKLEPTPIPLIQLLKNLGDGFSERSVRRWLMELIQAGEVERFGQKRSTTYQATQGKPLQNAPSSTVFSANNQRLVNDVRRPLFERKPVGYNEEWIESYQPNRSFYLTGKQREELHNAGKRSKNEEPAGTYAHHIFNRLLIDLSYNSSRLEGNTYSLLDTERLLFQGATAEGKLDEEKIMILNHKEAIRFLVDNAASIDVSLQTILSIHYLLADGLVEPQYAGKVRDHGVRIGGSSYIPFEEKRTLEKQLKQIIRKAEAIKDPFEQSFFLLIHLSYLQPFSDVNKRTARLCANIPLIKLNYVPQSFNDVSREDYTSAIIAIYELQKPDPLAELYIYSYQSTCIQYDATIKAIGYDEIRVQYRRERRDLLREIILMKLTGSSLKKHAALFTSKHIPLELRIAFIEDLEEDLEQLDLSRIAGLDITPDDLKAWQQLL